LEELSVDRHDSANVGVGLSGDNAYGEARGLIA